MSAVAEPDDPFPWATIMAAGFGLLRLPTHDFWAMTPKEFRAALGTPSIQAELSRPMFEHLMQKFPDENEGAIDARRNES